MTNVASLKSSIKTEEPQFASHGMVGRHPVDMLVVSATTIRWVLVSKSCRNADIYEFVCSVC